MIRCPNLRDDRTRNEFNTILTRLGGQAMTAADVSPRQAYLGRLNEQERRAYNIGHYLWNAHKTPAEAAKFMDALDGVRAALEKPAEQKSAPAGDKMPARRRRAWVEIGRNEEGQTLYEDENGVRSYVQNGVRHVEPVPISLTRAGVQAEPPKHRDRFILQTEIRTPVENVEKPTEKSNVDLQVNTPAVRLAEALVDKIARGKLTARDLQAEAAKVYGGTLAEGKFDRKDIQDALELAVNLYVRDTPHVRVDSSDPRQALKMLDEILADLPAQRVRSEEQESFQQFSTPPNYAAAAAYAAALRPREIVLEPSAGTGSLIAASWGQGRRFIANELSPRRAELLKALIGKNGEVFTENAEQLNNILPDSVKPTVVVMNPPFSQTAGRLGSKKDPMVAAQHIEQALKRLEPGGRLVAIVGRGMTMGAPVYRPWWAKISKDYSVRANIGVEGKVYEKYGTTFGTRLLVIDKVQPKLGEKPVLADAQTADELTRILEPIRNARDQSTAAEPNAAEQGGAGVAQAGAEEPRPGTSSPVPAATRGARPEARGERGVAGEGSTLAPAPGRTDVRVEAGERNGVAPVQPERAGQVGTGKGAARGPEARAKPEAGGGRGTERNLQPATGDDDAATTRSERIELEHADPGTQGASEISESLYDRYRPQRVRVPGAKAHPSALVESAAMASVAPTNPTYKPRLPRKVIEKGLLSEAQIEPVIYAGEAHAKMLPAAEGETPKRKGFFIGDGTGVGKGREVAGIILDNWNQGRRKAVWVSEKKTLLQDAKRDWSGLEQNPGVLFDVGKVKTGEPIQAKEGIAFITYDTLKGGMSDQRALARGAFVRKQQVSVNGQSGSVQRIEQVRGKPAQITVNLDNGTTITVPANEVKAEGAPSVKSRVDQLVDWFGKDFDGVIAFDESHNMGNGTDIKGERGVKDAAQKAIAGMMLQDRLPNARVVYVSATGATEVSNLSYADRLGLWGRGTPFASREKFVTEVEKGGIAAMELIARDMKQLGLYTARNLSYDGVEYQRLEHKLDENQREIYDTLAEAWQVVLRNINEALETTGGNKDARAKSAAMSAFWGAHQRFFNQIITSMQMPSVIKAVEQDIAEGRQAVLQLTSTNEASQERAAAKVQSAEEIEDLDITPRDQIIQLVEKSFPTQQYEKYRDENGKERARPVVDKAGNPVQNKEAVQLRDYLVDKLASVRVPQGPLDMVLDHFGTDVVAEVTGRGRRFVRKRDEKTGEMKRMEESRPASSNIAETDAFQNGTKKVLIFSEAGGTGRSYHADKTAPSKNARRVHYLVQGGWRADKAVQGFGRTHRSNQQSAPVFKLVTTDLQGQKRFISSIARRLAQLGALTKGQRQAGDQGIFSARDNLESTEAHRALIQFFNDVASNGVPGVPVQEFEEQTGLKLRQTDDDGRDMGILQQLPPITQFLNRVLSLKIDLQNRVFEAFSDRLDAVIEARRQAGLLDVGLETVKADKITKDSEQVVHRVEGTDAETKYVKLTLANKFVPTDFKSVANNEWRPVKFWVKSPNGKVYGVAEAPNLTDEAGKIIDNYRVISPVSDSRIVPRGNIDGRDSKWTKIDKGEARNLWQEEIDKAPEYVTRDLHLITGAILPIWDRLRGNPRVVRLQTDKGERFIGRVVPNSDIAATLKSLGAEIKGKAIDPKGLFSALMVGSRATLANGWTLSRRLVAGEHRIELKGPTSFSEGQEAKKDGLFTEKIDYKLRYFVPTEPAQGAEVLARLIQYRPVVELTEAGSSPDEMAAEPMFSAKGSFSVEEPDWDLAAQNKVLQALRAELDRMGLGDVALRVPYRVTARGYGKRFELNGYYFQKAIHVAFNSDDRSVTLHHEALHALRDLGAFLDTEWQLLANQAARTWRQQFNIDKMYAHLDEDGKNEEGVAHAFGAWAAGKLKVDGRLARLFKRIRAFLEAIRNAFRGLGFKTAEDVFRDIKSGEVGRRGATPAAGDEAKFEDEGNRQPLASITERGVQSTKRTALSGEIGGDALPVQDQAMPLSDEVKDAMVAAYNEMLPSVEEQYDRFAGKDRTYTTLTAKDAENIFGDDREDWPPKLRELIDKHDKAVEIIESQNSDPQWFAPDDPRLPSREEFMHTAVKDAEGLLPARDLGDIMDGLATRTEGAEGAASAALKVLARSMGWEATSGVRYFRVERRLLVGERSLADLDAEAGDIVSLKVRVSDHGNTTRNPNAPRGADERNDINLAPGAHDFEDARRILADAVVGEGSREPEQSILSSKPRTTAEARPTAGPQRTTDTDESQGGPGKTGAADVRGANREEPMFSVRADAERPPTPNLDASVRERIKQVLERSKPALNKFVEGVQDLSHPVKLLQQELELRREGAFDDPENFYTRKRLYPGRLGAWVDTFNKNHLDTIVRLLKANDIGLQQAADYLYALHAPERNAAMDKINPGLGGEGSGMSDEDAARILAEAKRSGKAAAFDELRTEVGKIRDLILDVMERAGLEKPEVIAEWRKKYEDYVPLRGWEVEPENAPPEYRGPGAGFNVRGKEVKQAFGRRSKADNPLVNLLDQAYRTFDRAERNRYLQSLYRAIDNVKDDAKDIATLDRGQPRKEIDPRTGLVRTVENAANYFNPKAVYLKFDGVPHFIVFKDQDLAEAVKRMSPDSLNGILRGLLVLQNKMKALWTHYSPDFLVRHFLFRYPIEGTLNSFEQKESGQHSVAQYLKDAVPFAGDASRAIFATNKQVTADNPRVAEMQKYWQEMRRAGGAMVFRNMRDTDLLREHLQTALKDLSRSPVQNARARWRHAIEALDTVTNALDNSLRLAAYASARKQGKTPQQAALIAREATVDFQLKGRWSSHIGLWLIFNNVATQTAARMVRAVGRSKIMRRVFMGTMMMGFITAAFNYLVAGSDKDGIPFFEKIPEWDRRLNFIILNPWDTDAKGRPQPIKIPMPYNWALPLALGYAFGTRIFGKEEARKTVAMITKSLLESLTPLGSEQNKVALVAPEIVRPLVHVYTNEDWTGRPIHLDQRFQKRPNAFSARRTTGEGWQKIAQGVNAATGGSRIKSGLVDLYPEDYRELISHFVGTQLRLGENLGETFGALAKGEPPPATKTPLVRVVHGADYDAADRARAYELRDKRLHPWKY